MADAEGESGRWRYRHSVREHVRAPLSASLSRVEREQGELDAERAALARFAAKVEAMEPVAASSAGADGALGGEPAGPGGALKPAADRGDGKRAAVREAYRETVVDLDHYDAVYDESLLVNAASELGGDVAAALRTDADLAFTEHVQSVVVAAATDAAERRGEFHDRIAAERRSVEAAREELSELIDGLDGSDLPSWYRPAFDDRLDDLLARRQDRLRSRTAYRQDGHDLCEYVYAEEPWTYPVLTAVARLRNSVG